LGNALALLKNLEDLASDGRDDVQLLAFLALPAQLHERGLRKRQLVLGDPCTELGGAQLFFAAAVGGHSAVRVAPRQPSLLHDRERSFRFLLCEITMKLRAVDRGLCLTASGHRCVDARLRLGSSARVQKRGRQRHQARKDLTLFDRVAGLQVESSQVAGNRCGDEVPVFDSCSAVFVDGNEERPPRDRRDLDFDRVRDPCDGDEAHQGQHRQSDESASNPLPQTGRPIHAPALLTL